MLSYDVEVVAEKGLGRRGAITALAPSVALGAVVAQCGPTLRLEEVRMICSRCRAAALLLLVSSLFGCTTWKPVPVSPEGLGESATVRVTGRDGGRVAIADPVIVGDSLTGVRMADSPLGPTLRGEPRFRIALREVSRLEVETRTGQFVTAGLIVGAAAVGIGGLIWYSMAAARLR